VCNLELVLVGSPQNSLQSLFLLLTLLQLGIIIVILDQFCSLQAAPIVTNVLVSVLHFLDQETRCVIQSRM